MQRPSAACCFHHPPPSVLQPPAALISGSKVLSGSCNHEAHIWMPADNILWCFDGADNQERSVYHSCLHWGCLGWPWRVAVEHRGGSLRFLFITSSTWMSNNLPNKVLSLSLFLSVTHSLAQRDLETHTHPLIDTRSKSFVETTRVRKKRVRGFKWSRKWEDQLYFLWGGGTEQRHHAQTRTFTPNVCSPSSTLQHLPRTRPTIDLPIHTPVVRTHLHTVHVHMGDLICAGVTASTACTACTPVTPRRRMRST